MYKRVEIQSVNAFFVLSWALSKTRLSLDICLNVYFVSALLTVSDRSVGAFTFTARQLSSMVEGDSHGLISSA